ncbi:hypothetical protein D3C81_1796530 [compost metagenome]
MFDFDDILPGGNTGSVTDPENMGVDGHGQLSERRVQHHICSLSADSWQCLKLFPGLRHLTAMQLHQHAAGLDDILRLAVVQTDSLDVLGQALDAERMNRRRGVGYREQLGRGFIDADIGRLRREDHCDQQFEGR